MEQGAESGLNFLKICYPMARWYSEVRYTYVKILPISKPFFRSVNARPPNGNRLPIFSPGKIHKIDPPNLNGVDCKNASFTMCITDRLVKYAFLL